MKEDLNKKQSNSVLSTLRKKFFPEKDAPTISVAEPMTMTTNARHPIYYSFGNIQQQGARDYQEDAFGFSEVSNSELFMQKGFMAIIADGMGGLKDGKIASEDTVETFLKSFASLDVEGNIPIQLRALAEKANSVVFTKEQGNAGTTLVCTHIWHDHLYWIAIGDSAIYLFRNGELYEMNQEHSCLNSRFLEYIYGKISKEELAADPRLQAITSNIGREQIPELDQNILPFKLLHRDKLLLCSDGVSGRLSKEEIIQAMNCHEAQECCEMIRHMVQQKHAPKQDNYTAEVICCE